MTKLADFTIEELMIFTATIMASCGIFMKICFTSKCKKVSVFCGLIKCDRSVEAVIEQEKIDLQNNNNNNNNENIDENIV